MTFGTFQYKRLRFDRHSLTPLTSLVICLFRSFAPTSTENSSSNPNPPLANRREPWPSLSVALEVPGSVRHGDNLAAIHHQILISQPIATGWAHYLAIEQGLPALPIKRHHFPPPMEDRTAILQQHLYIVLLYAPLLHSNNGMLAQHDWLLRCFS